MHEDSDEELSEEEI